MIKEIAHALLPTEYGDFVIYGFEDKERKEEIVVLTAGDMQSKDSLLIRIHSKCLT